jgi:hypothetical protein
MGNEHKYQTISKILNNSREATSKCMLILLFLKDLFFVLCLGECSLYPSIAELVIYLQSPSMSNYSS